MATDLRARHTHPVLILVVIVCFAVIIAVLTFVASESHKAAEDARETAAIARAVTDPTCDPDEPACQRAMENRQRQASAIPDINEVSVIAAYCGNQHGTLEEVRTCVEREFKARTGRDTTVGPEEE